MGKYSPAAGGDMGDPRSPPAPSSHQDLLLCSPISYSGSTPGHPHPLDLHHHNRASPRQQRHCRGVSLGPWGTGWVRGRAVALTAAGSSGYPCVRGLAGTGRVFTRQPGHLGVMRWGPRLLSPLCVPPRGWLRRGCGRALAHRALQKQSPSLVRKRTSPVPLPLPPALGDQP